MKPVPNPKNTPVLRTDFSNQSAWERIRAVIQRPVGILGFRANVDFIEDMQYAGITKEELLALIPANYNHTFIILVDQTTIAHPEHPLLILDLFDQPAREFRALPSTVQGIENNLSIANMDFEEFAEAVDAEGIFRGFPDDPHNPLFT